MTGGLRRGLLGGAINYLKRSLVILLELVIGLHEVAEFGGAGQDDGELGSVLRSAFALDFDGLDEGLLESSIAEPRTLTSGIYLTRESAADTHDDIAMPRAWSSIVSKLVSARLATET